MVGTLAMTALWVSIISAWLSYRRLTPIPVQGIVETLLTMMGLIVVLRYLRPPFLALLVLEDAQVINSVAAMGLLVVFWLRWR